ncbi:hypothetical protein BH24ACT19_BH24ACT19_00070 [soil metagenome]|jgi:sec-independent protein translocase protein TatC
MAGRLRIPTRPRDEAQMSLLDHLDELRSRIIKVAVAFFAVAIVAWFFREQIYYALLAPAPSLEGRLSFTSVTAPIITDIKLTLYTAFLLTIPILLYQIWAFVAPAVGDMGRAFTYILISLASSLFLAGVAFGYFVVLPIGIDFLLGWAPERYDEIITADTYLGFVTRFLLAFGIVFEFPAATYVGAKLGLVTAPFLKSYRKHAIVANTILAAALTPGQDPFSMILMAIPMIFMYEVSIIIARFVNPVAPEEELPTEPDDDEGEREDEREDAVERDL